MTFTTDIASGGNGVEKVVEYYIYDDTRSDIALPSGETITLYIQKGVVKIENAPVGALIEAHTASGTLMQSMRVTDKVTSLTLPRNAVYIISIGEKTFKVKLCVGFCGYTVLRLY